MIKNMRFLLLSLFTFFLYNNAMAQILTCPSQAPTYHLNISEAPIKYELNYFSYQIPREGYQESNQHTLGSFQHRTIIKTTANIKGLRNQNSSCTYVSDLYLDIQLVSSIYIAREAQNFQCTYQRVLNHEHTHYAIEKSAFSTILQNFTPLIKNQFDNLPINYNNQIDLNAFLQQKSNYLSLQISNYIKEASLPYHQRLDTKENYKYESNLCSEEENKQLTKLLIKK